MVTRPVPVSLPWFVHSLSPYERRIPSLTCWNPVIPGINQNTLWWKLSLFSLTGERKFGTTGGQGELEEIGSSWRMSLLILLTCYQSVHTSHSTAIIQARRRVIWNSVGKTFAYGIFQSTSWCSGRCWSIILLVHSSQRAHSMNVASDEFRRPICPKKSSKFASYQLHPLHLHHT